MSDGVDGSFVRSITRCLQWAPTIPVRAGLFVRVSQVASTVAAIGLLAGVGYWGHHTGWKLPSFAEVAGDVPPPTAAWCDAHAVPEAECVECNPSLAPPLPDHGWCPDHGVHQCPLCHPEVAQVTPTPTITDADRERTERGLAVRERLANNNRCPLYKRRIQFATREAMADVGVDIALAEARPIVETVTAPAEIGYDPTRVAHVSARARGRSGGSVNGSATRSKRVNSSPSSTPPRLAGRKPSCSKLGLRSI